MLNNIKYIVIFGSDAYGSYLLEDNAGSTFKMLMEKGAYSLNSRSVVPIMSSVNWTSLLCGTAPNFHGRTQWDSETGDAKSVYDYVNNKNVPSIFTLFKKQTNLKTAAFFRWSQFQYILDVNSLDYWSNVMVKDVDSWKPTKKTIWISSNDNIKPNQMIIDDYCQYLIAKKPELSFVYVNEPDTVGHKIGHQTTEIKTMALQVDLWVKQVLETISHISEMKDNTLFVFIADHGGKGQGDDCHGNFNDYEIKVPVFFYGAGVKNTGQFLEQTIQYDITATLAWLMELDSPDYWQGKVIYSPFINYQEYYEDVISEC
ncbi:alkaline phosphatase [Spiroplasma endosymbiont of Lonchoptera lutea]|uniref:alkaline phosphatase n=1 Tax=Spiroplasma endosymbiont of Lonchoptera lutea TaxID=3066297 RepID=UPI0030D48B23